MFVLSQATDFLQGDPAVLVIPRKSAEGIVIGGNIILTIIEVQDDEVRLAIEYPPGVTVQRREIDAELGGSLGRNPERNGVAARR